MDFDFSQFEDYVAPIANNCRWFVHLLIDHTNKKIILEEIEVEAQYRGMKLGSRLLAQVCWLADSLVFTVVLVPVCLDVPHKGLSLEQLESWYERYGFSLQENYEDGYPYWRLPQ